MLFSSTCTTVRLRTDTPDEILVLPSRSQASDLEDKDTVIVKQIVELLHEGLVAADTDVLGLLERNNLGEAASGVIGNVVSIHAQNASLARGNAADGHISNISLARELALTHSA